MSNELPLIAVTGATGALGTRIVSRLAERRVSQRIIVRDASRIRSSDARNYEVAVASGYDDRVGMTKALDGATTMVLISARETADRLAQHKSAIAAAVDANVRNIVYTSFMGASPTATFTLAREHYETERYIIESGIPYTFLRDCFYLDSLPMMASVGGVIAGPGGDGRCAWVSRDDVADVVVGVLTQAGHEGKTYDVTGGRADTFRYAAEQIELFAKRPVTYRNETIDEAYASRASYAVPKREVDGWISSYLAIANGEMNFVSDTVRKLTGHAPETFPDFLEKNPASYAHIAST